MRRATGPGWNRPRPRWGLGAGVLVVTFLIGLGSGWWGTRPSSSLAGQHGRGADGAGSVGRTRDAGLVPTSSNDSTDAGPLPLERVAPGVLGGLLESVDVYAAAKREGQSGFAARILDGISRSDPGVATALLRLYEGNKGSGRREAIIDLLGAVRSPGVIRILRSLYGAEDTTAGVRLRIIWALAARGTDEAYAALLGFLPGESDAAVYGDLVSALSQSGDESVLPVLRFSKEAAGDATSPVGDLIRDDLGRAAAAVVRNVEIRGRLEQIAGLDPASPGSFGPLREAILGGEAPVIRLAAMRKLAVSQDTRAGEILRQVAAADGDDRTTRLLAANARLMMQLQEQDGSVRDLPALEDATTPREQLVVMNALVQESLDGAAGSLSRLASDQGTEPWLRWTAVGALARVDTSEADHALENLLGDGDPAVRQRTIQILGVAGSERHLVVLDALTSVSPEERLSIEAARQRIQQRTAEEVMR